jgi:cohesin complex subunit SA-1/2
MVENALQILFFHLTWIFKRFTLEDGTDEAKVAAIKEKRNRALQIFQNFGVADKGNVSEMVRRQAFICFINIHMLFSPKSQSLAAKACPLSMPDEQQHRLGGAFAAAVERYAMDRDELEREREGTVMSNGEASEVPAEG